MEIKPLIFTMDAEMAVVRSRIAET